MKGLKGVVSIEREEEKLEELPPVPALPAKALKSVSNTLTSLKKEDGAPLVTKEEADILSNLRLKNGEQLLSMSERWFLYEVVWILNQVGYEKTVNFLSMNWEKVLGSQNIRKKMLFENPLMSKTKEKFALDMEIYRNKPDVMVGVEKCRKCGSDSTISKESQNRGCDESTTVKVVCLQCKNQWTIQ